MKKHNSSGIKRKNKLKFDCPPSFKKIISFDFRPQ